MQRQLFQFLLYPDNIQSISIQFLSYVTVMIQLIQKTFNFAFLLFMCLLLASTLAKSQYKVTQVDKNSSSVTLSLQYTGSDDYYVKPASSIIKVLKFVFRSLTFDDFTFKIIDPYNKRFQVPQYGAFAIDPFANFSFPIAASAVSFEYTKNPFDFKITRKQNGAVLFSTYNSNFVYSENYLEIGTELDSDYVYGFGERFQQSFRKKDGKWTMFNRDRGVVIDRGQGLQTYGYYPFYLLKEHNQLFHINYFRSSNALDVIKETKQDKHYLTYKVIGGIIDFRFFLGEQSPETTLQKLNTYAGRALIPPFWSLGFHQCRWGYKNSSDLLQVLKGYQKYGIPLDTIWTDIDYMIDYQDFTIDQQRFPLDQMNKILQKYHYIPIIDAGIKTVGPAYEEGLDRGVYVTDAFTKKPLVGKVWPGPTTFVDFFHPNASQYWQDMLDRLYKKVPFSGVWLDMNQIANFCDGPCQNYTDPSIFDYSKDLPYQPGSDNVESHTISLNSTHYGNLSQANVHAFHALLQNQATHKFLRSKNVKPFIISRSSTLGQSKFGFHWTGDNNASFDFLKGSIADAFNNQLFGFQMSGPDICGFSSDTSEQLCSRWFQLAALYTFARNHNAINSKSQEPYALGSVVRQSARNNLKLRYSLLKYYYYLFVSKKGLGTIWRPLFFEYPEDPNTYIDDIADTELLLGGNLLATPIVEEGTTSRKIYLPQDNWYSIYTGVRYAPGTHLIENVELTDKVPAFVREGHILFQQSIFGVVNTKQLDNYFYVLSGLRSRSNTSTYKTYESAGAILSIKDYNNDSLVDLCTRDGCQYVFRFVANISDTKRTLQVNITYQGGRNLNEQIFIEQIHLSFAEEILILQLDDPLQVTGSKSVEYTIPRSSNSYNLREQ